MTKIKQHTVQVKKIYCYEEVEVNSYFTKRNKVTVRT